MPPACVSLYTYVAQVGTKHWFLQFMFPAGYASSPQHTTAAAVDGVQCNPKRCAVHAMLCNPSSDESSALTMVLCVAGGDNTKSAIMAAQSQPCTWFTVSAPLPPWLYLTVYPVCEVLHLPVLYLPSTFPMTGRSGNSTHLYTTKPCMIQDLVLFLHCAWRA